MIGKKLSIFISTQKGSLTELHISKSQFRYIYVGLSVFSLLLCGILVDYSFSFSSRLNHQKYQAENQQLKEQLQNMRAKVEQLDARFSQIADFSRKIKVIAGVEQAASSFTAVGPLSSSSFPDLTSSTHSHASHAKKPEAYMGSRGLDSDSKPTPTSFSSDSIQIYIERLDRHSKLLHQDITSLMGKVYERKDVLASTPSIMPTKGWVSSRFGYRQYPFTGEVSMHEGIDIASLSGTPIYSPAYGVIVFAGYKTGYGKVIVIDHGYELSTLYGHLSEIMVLKGQKIKRGEAIGAIGSTGHSSGPHLHYEVRISDVPVDPANYILNTM